MTQPRRVPMLFLLVLVSAAALWGCERREAPTGDTAVARDPAVAGGAAAEESAAGELGAAAGSAVDAIDAGDLKDWIGTLAADDMQGRGPGSSGDRQARDYLARELESLGYAPGAPDGSWQQPFALVGIHSQQPPAWQFAAGEQTVTLEQSSEFIVASGVQQEQATVEEAELVFVGYGIQAPEYEWDDFKGQNLAGKVLVMLNNDPDWDPELFEGETRLYYGRWTYKYESAAEQGAAGAIIIHTEPSAGYPWQVVQTSWTGEQFELPAGDEPRMQIEGWVTEPAAGKLFSAAGKDLAELVEAAKSRSFEPVPLGITTSLRLANELSETGSANVLGLLRGNDEALAGEAVLYTAHHDHLGVGTPDDSGDRIYNGARDNAAGVGMVLSIAKAMASMAERPRRSILIALVGAEEQGLLGSKYLAENPPLPAGRIAAVVNYDAPNIWGETRDITYVGMGKSTLDEVARQVARHQGREVHSDPFPERGFFYRSDQFSLARVGVPGLYLKGGTDFPGKPEGWGRQRVDAYTREHYHQPSDELDQNWNFDGLVQDARFGFLAGLIVANRDEMPSWYPGDEFEAARQEALEAID